MAARPILGFVSLFLVGGGCLLLFFLVLSGDGLGSPENKIYFLRAQTSQIPTAKYPETAWTYLALCGYKDGKLYDCGNTQAALPFDPGNNFGTHKGIPPSLIDTRYYFYMSRFSWAFYLIALAFGVFSLFCGLLALFTRIGAYLSGLLCGVATVFQVLATCLMTCWVVKGRDAFNGIGHPAAIGDYGLGFSWATVVTFFFASVLFCIGGGVGRGIGGGAGGGAGKHVESTGKKPRWGVFGRRRGTRSKASLREGVNEDGGIKDEYS